MRRRKPRKPIGRKKFQTGGRTKPIKKYHMGGPGPNPPAVDPNDPFGNTNLEYHEHQCSNWSGENFFILPGQTEIDPYGWFPPDGNINRRDCKLAGGEYNPWVNPNPAAVAGCSEWPCCHYNEETKNCEPIGNGYCDINIIPNETPAAHVTDCQACGNDYNCCIIEEFGCIWVTGLGAGSGDVNQDGQVDIQDIVMIVEHALGSNQLIGQQLQAADYNNDGMVNVMDVLGIIEDIIVQAPPQQRASMRQKLQKALAPLGVNIMNTNRQNRRGTPKPNMGGRRNMNYRRGGHVRSNRGAVQNRRIKSQKNPKGK